MSKIAKYLIIFFLTVTVKANAFENKIILKVNKDIITTFDILEEINTLKFFNSKLDEISKDEIYQISLDSILKYRIKKNEIIKQFGKIELNEPDYLITLIQNSYEKLGFKNLKEFKIALKNKNIDYENYEQKLKIDILWNQIIYALYSEKIVIKEDEIKKQVESQNDFLDSFELGEIVFQINNSNDLSKVYSLIKRDIDELGFENAAIKHSISKTAANGGSLGWINENQIDEKILEKLNKLTNNGVTEPIRIQSGFLILKKIDTKKIEKNLNFAEEVKKLINYQAETQLNNYSNIYLNKVRKDLNINAP